MKKTMWLILAIMTILLSGVTHAITAEVYYSDDDNDLSGVEVTDLTGNGHNGTNHNGVLTGQAGVINQSFWYDGTDDYTATLDDYNTTFSTCAWIKLDATATQDRIVSNQLAAFDGWSFMVDNDNKLRFYTNAVDCKDNLALDDGNWHFVCMTMDDITATGDVVLYINDSVAISCNGKTGNGVLGSMEIGCYDSTNCFDGYIDEWSYYTNKILNLTEVQELFNNGTGYNPHGYALPTNLSITATDEWSGGSITNFSATVNGTTYHTTVGQINTTILSASDVLINITIYNATNYFNRTYINYNVSSNLAVELHQAELCLNATEKISGGAVNNVNFSSGANSGTCFNISAGTHEFNASKTGWNNQTQNITVTALSNATQTIVNMSYNTLTVYAKDATTGTYLANYQLNLTSLNHTGWVGEHHASTTNQTFDIINGTYTILIDATGYATTGAAVNVSVTGDGTHTFNLYPTNSLNITFYDENDGTALIGPNVTFEIILDDANASTGSTNDSTFWIDNLDAGSYEIRYRATGDGYGERSYYFNLTNRTYNVLSLYLLNQSSTESITTTLYDEYGNRLEGYTIRLLRYYASESGYIIVDEGLTNSEGQTVVTAIRNGPYYKFRIVSPAGIVLKTTSSTQIYDTSISLYVTLGEGIGQQLENLNDISFELVWLNASDQFRFTWDAASGLVVSVTTYVYEVDTLNGDSLHNSSTSTSASGTMYVWVLRQNDTTYKAMSYVTFTDETEPTLLDTLTVTFDETIVIFGKLGLYLTFLIVMVLAFTGLWNPAAPCVLVPLGLIITRVARLHALEWTWIIAITAVGAIIIYLIRDKT